MSDDQLLPAVGEDEAPFWEASAQGELKIQSCATMGLRTILISLTVRASCLMASVALKAGRRPVCVWIRMRGTRHSGVTGLSALFTWSMAMKLY